MNKILLYYKYISITDPQAIKQWQHDLCKSLSLTGRIIIAPEGINGTVYGTPEVTDQYQHAMNNHELFTGIDFKESLVEPGFDYFTKLKVMVRDEIVHLGVKNAALLAQGGKHLTPEQVHELLSQHDDDLVILDARNYVESRVGAFKNAIKPEIHHFRELPEYLDKNLEQFKDKKVLMYCTGGVRCELATALLNVKGVAKEVYQAEGGIHRYVEQYPDGFFRGKNYVFDGRMTVKVNDDILGTCDLCITPCDEYTSCLNAKCNKLFIACAQCFETFNNTCSAVCQQLVETNQVPRRPEPITVVQRARKVSSVINK